MKESASSRMPLNSEIRHLLQWAKAELKILGSREAQNDSERLLEEMLGVERTQLYMRAGETIPAEVAKQYRQLIRRRKRRIPLAYLLKKAYFWNEVLEVGPDCLIPRPETEILVDSFIKKSGFGKKDFFTFADVGSGSGAIGIALLRHFRNAHGIFLDISPAALKITKRNIETYHLSGRSDIWKSDLLKALLDKSVSVNAVISNPPYVAKKDWKKLEPEVLQEPHLALDGGQDGMDFYRRIVAQAVGAGFPRPNKGEATSPLQPNGLICFELGYGLSKPVKKVLEKSSFSKIEIVKDYNQIDRVMLGRRDA